MILATKLKQPLYSVGDESGRLRFCQTRQDGEPTVLQMKEPETEISQLFPISGAIRKKGRLWKGYDFNCSGEGRSDLNISVEEPS